MRRYAYNRFGEIKKFKDKVFAYRIRRAKGRIAFKRETLRIKVPKKHGGFRIKKHKRIERYVYDKRGRLVKVYRGEEGISASSNITPMMPTATEPKRRCTVRPT